MAAKEIYDYLSNVTEDYDYTLDLSTISSSVREEGFKSQDIYWGSGRNVQSKVYSDSSVFNLYVNVSSLSASTIGTIIDLYNDTSKANGFINSFRIALPDGHTYVALFNCEIERVFKITHQEISVIKFLVIGF